MDAGTTPVRTEIEPGGDVDWGTAAQWDGVFENATGAIFWTGFQWTTDNMWAHTYFWDLRTDRRFKTHTLHAIDPSPATLGPVAGVPGGYTVTKSLHTYTARRSAPGAAFRYTAVRYDVLQPDGTAIVLLSRGTGNGTAKAYLDAYIQDGDGAGATAAVLGGAVLYRFPGMSPAQAALQPADLGSAGVLANLPTCTPSDRAQYWLDVNGGSDMGGVSYHVRTQCLSPVATEHQGDAFAAQLQVEFLDAQGQIRDLRFAPAIAEEAPGGPHLRRRLPGRRVP